MLRENARIEQVYLASRHVDICKSINGLSALVKEGFELDPFQEAYFVFCNKDRNKVKILHWDRNGFWLYYKRLERGRFKWPTTAKDDNTIALSSRELWGLLVGLTLEQSKAGYCGQKVLARELI